ncbi:MAG: type IV toxin-antitoxin system AbiEi family antitoxin, partial [Thermofilaceae archaeon]
FKGVYSFKKSPYLAVKALPKAYVGLSAAAFLHGAWNQVTAVVVLSPCVSSTVRGGVREVAGYKVILRRISEKMYFGYTYLRIEELGEEVRVSDPEKTAIDLIYFKHPARFEILPALLQYCNREKLSSYIHLLRERGVKGWKKVLIELNPAS